MTPVPIELPVKTGEATVLAELVFEHAEGRKLTEGIRNRIGARLESLRLSSMKVLCGSLQRDPVHPSTYYIVVDPAGAESDRRLLRLALASSPSSGLFPNSLLIGRMRTSSGRETVVNAIPFAVKDRDQIRRYAEDVDREFLPKVTGAVPGLTVCTPVERAKSVWYESVWRAIRAGWREGWSAALEVNRPFVGDHGRSLAADFTRFSIPPDDEALTAHAFIASVRRQFDFEIDLRSSPAETTAEQITETLQSWRALGKPVQSIAPRIHFGPAATFADRLRLVQDAARQGNALLSFACPDEIIGKVTGGRVNYRSSTFSRP